MSLFSADLYIQLFRDRVAARNVVTGEIRETRPVQPFSHPRALVGDFHHAEQAVRAAVRELLKVRIALWIRAVVHPMELIDGGLTVIERRILRELAKGGGMANRVVIWEGPALTDATVRDKLKAGR